MIRNKAHFLGAAAGVLFVSAWFGWQRFGPTPCTGGVTLEFSPALREPGRYRFRLLLDDMKQPCEFEVPLPVQGRVETPCGLALELKTQIEAARTSIVSLTVGAAPETLSIAITKNSEALYEARLTPVYGPYETPREESKRFCGERALVGVTCLRGSSPCAPFEPACDGPEDCAAGKICCANPDSGREYGPSAATQCGSTRRCLDRFGFVACHLDVDCPADMECGDSSLTKDFKRPVLACRPRRGAPR